MNGAKSNRNEKLNNSAISFKCQVKGDDILAFSNRLKKRTYEYATPLGEMHINTHSSNVIYITAWDWCRFQYVGEIVQKLNKRHNWYKSVFRNPSKYGHCKILSEYFLSGLCKGAKYRL